MPAPINSRPGDVVMLDEPTDILCSFFYFRDVDVEEVHSWGTRIVGDSGAFSALTSGSPIDREEFHAWAWRWRDHLLWTAALDVIGDAKATRINWLAARADGLDLVPTLHYPSPPSSMDAYVEEGATLLGLGGMVPYAAETERLMRWALTMFRHARDHHPQVRFHGWGVSHSLLLDNLPWWSADSSAFASAFRFAVARLFDPDAGRFVAVDMDGHSMARYSRLLTKHYDGLDWREIANAGSAVRRPVGRASLKALQHYGRWLRQRQVVDPPALLLARLPQLVGPTLPDHLLHLPPLDPSPSGTLPVAALGASSMQPIRAISPLDHYGPSLWAALGGERPNKLL
jgi:hypothetical protein